MAMSGKLIDLVVIGGGISGLGMAHFARNRGLQALVLEASRQPGGCLRSHCFERPEGAVWAELGAHTCYNSYGNLLQMLEQSGQLQSLQAKQKQPYRLWVGNAIKSIASQFNWLELSAVPLRLLLSKKAGRSVRDYFGGIIGRHNYQRFLGPALDAVACQPADDIPAESLFRKKPRRKEILRSYTGPRGVQSFVDGIVAAGLDLRCDQPVVRIEQSAEGFQVETADGSRFAARKLALAIAPDQAAKLLRQLRPELAEQIGAVQMAEVESLAVLLKAESLGLEPVAGIIGRDGDFYSAVSRDPVPDPNYRAFTFHFHPGVLDDEGKVQQICQVLGVERAALLDQVAHQNRLPALRLGHAGIIETVDRLLESDSLALTGNWFAGVSIEDSLQRSAAEAARLLG
jgi:protoporphyrinogen oxidase